MPSVDHRPKIIENSDFANCNKLSAIEEIRLPNPLLNPASSFLNIQALELLFPTRPVALTTLVKAPFLSPVNTSVGNHFGSKPKGRKRHFNIRCYMMAIELSRQC